VADFFHAVATNVPPANRASPRHLYIDRSHSRLRPLVNERDLVAPLAAMGFAIVRPETMSVADQVRLFRGAETIVAPHGAALTNLAYCNWCFRNLAGLMQLRYDCVLGRARKPWRDLDLAFHLTPWEISVNHVIAAVAQTAERAAA
jgi:hypothetical protein